MWTVITPPLLSKFTSLTSRTSSPVSGAVNSCGVWRRRPQGSRTSQVRDRSGRRPRPALGQRAPPARPDKTRDSQPSFERREAFRCRLFAGIAPPDVGDEARGVRLALFQHEAGFVPRLVGAQRDQHGFAGREAAIAASVGARGSVVGGTRRLRRGRPADDQPHEADAADQDNGGHGLQDSGRDPHPARRLRGRGRGSCAVPRPSPGLERVLLGLLLDAPAGHPDEQNQQEHPECQDGILLDEVEDDHRQAGQDHRHDAGQDGWQRRLDAIGRQEDGEEEQPFGGSSGRV